MSLTFSLVNIAAASEAASSAAAQPSVWASLMPMVLIMAVFYVFLIRPSQQKMKEHQRLISALSKGDAVVTSGGLFGNVISIDTENNVLMLEIADGVKVKVKKDMVTEVMTPKDAGKKEVKNKAAKK
jgi:preprotein translocase subunit YajC